MPPNQHGRKFYASPDDSKRAARHPSTPKLPSLPSLVQKSGILRVPIPRPSRSILKSVDERAHSSDRILESRKTPLVEENSSTAERSSSAEILQSPSVSPARRPDQTYSQSNASKLTSYFLQMESNGFADERIYPVIRSSKRRLSQGVSDGSSTSNSSSSNTDFHFRDAASGSFSDESATSLLMLVQRRNKSFSTDTSTSPLQSKDSWIESSTRSQFTDLSYEKKRVRFADMEGLTLETTPTRTFQRTPAVNKLLSRRKQMQINNPVRGQTTRPVFNTLYQTIAGVSGGHHRRSKLITDV